MSLTVDRVLWQAMVEENLFDNAAIKAVQAGLKNDGAYLNATSIVIPNAGAPAGITAGNNSYPVSIQQRSDLPLVYHLTNLEVEPVLVQYKEQMPLSYNKTESILNDALSGIGERAAREIITRLYSTSQTRVKTTGANAPAHAPSGTGTRKILTFNDVRSAVAELAKQNVPMNDLGLFLDTTMYFQLLSDLQKDGNYNFPEKAVGFTLPGINNLTVYPMTNVLFVQTSTYALRPIGHAGGATDFAAALLVSKSATSFAMDDVQVFAEEQKADYYGAIYSATTWLGGSYRRLDFKGIVPIVQTVGA